MYSQRTLIACNRQHARPYANQQAHNCTHERQWLPLYTVAWPLLNSSCSALPSFVASCSIDRHNSTQRFAVCLGSSALKSDCGQGSGAVQGPPQEARSAGARLLVSAHLRSLQTEGREGTMKQGEGRGGAEGSVCFRGVALMLHTDALLWWTQAVRMPPPRPPCMPHHGHRPDLHPHNLRCACCTAAGRYTCVSFVVDLTAVCNPDSSLWWEGAYAGNGDCVCRDPRLFCPAKDLSTSNELFLSLRVSLLRLWPCLAWAELWGPLCSPWVRVAPDWLSSGACHL